MVRKAPILDDSFSDLSPEPNWDDPMGELTIDEIVDEMEAEDNEPEVPKPVFTRQSTASILAMGWSVAGSGLIKYGSIHEHASGRVMQLQSIAAGNELDKLIAGTFVDRILQRFVGIGGKLESFGAIFAGPVVASLMSRNGKFGEKLSPILLESVLTSLADAGPILAEQKAVTKEKLAAIEVLKESLELEKDADPLEALFVHIFQDTIAAQEDEEVFATVPED
jgi:hypothetical protein